MKWTFVMTKRKYLIGIFLILFFLNANITAINRGPCVVSPCQSDDWDMTINDSNIATDQISDWFIHTEFNLILAPVALALTLIPVDKQIRFNQPFWLKAGIDSPREKLSPQDVGSSSDLTRTKLIYILIKVFMLLHLPLWYLLASEIIKKPWRIAAALGVLLIFSVISLFSLFNVIEYGATTLTWKVLF